MSLADDKTLIVTNRYIVLVKNQWNRICRLTDVSVWQTVAFSKL